MLLPKPIVRTRQWSWRNCNTRRRRELATRSSKSTALQTIGDLHLARGDIGASEASFETMLQIARDRSDRSAEVNVSAMAQLALYKRDRVTAIEILEGRLGSVAKGRDQAAIAWNLGELVAAEGERERPSR